MVKLFFAIFAPFSDSCRCPPREEAAGRGPIYRKKRYLRFVLDASESGNSKLVVKNKATMTLMDMWYPLCMKAVIGFSMHLSFIYISAWASALLVLLLGRCQSLDAWDE